VSLLHIYYARNVTQRIMLEIYKTCSTEFPSHQNSSDLISTLSQINGHLQYDRSIPLGYDRYGCEYWLLHAQHTTLFSSLGAQSGPSVQRSDPAVIVKNPKTKKWYRHSGIKVEKVFSNLSVDIPCEKLLQFTLVQELLRARKDVFDGPLQVKISQRDLLHQRRKADKWLYSFSPSLYHRLLAKDQVKLLELIWARCVEIRLSVHYANLRHGIMDVMEEIQYTGYDRDLCTKRKKIRDGQTEESFDYHPNKGWIRSDTFSKIRLLGSTTVAARFINEGNIYAIFQSTMRRYRPTMNDEKVSNELEILEGYLSKIQADRRALDNADAAGAGSTQNAQRRSSGRLSSAAALSGGGSDGEDEEDGEDGEGDMVDNVGDLEEDGADDIGGVDMEDDPNVGSMSRVKPVEQVEIDTGRVLRRYSSGKEAAKMMQASQSGISLCCKGKKVDAYGFKWRFYDGRSLLSCPYLPFHTQSE